MVYSFYIINFSTDTYGVQSLNVTDTSDDSVYCVCVFGEYSTDTGCTVQLISTTDQYNGTFNRTDDTASGNITGVVTGVYTIRAFDQGSNIVAVELLNIAITGEPLVTTTTTSVVSTVTNSSPPTTSISASKSMQNCSVAIVIFT